MLKPGGKQRSATEAMIQAVVALALLIVLPLAVGEPETPRGFVAAVVVAMILVVFLLEGVARFIRNRRRPYPDSIMPPPKPGDRKLPSATRED
ncbi:MAG TPA: hypothetical protein VIF38_13715 [Burkholderiales bacterium]|jgi:uncharacterized membrane protein